MRLLLPLLLSACPQLLDDGFELPPLRPLDSLTDSGEPPAVAVNLPGPQVDDVAPPDAGRAEEPEVPTSPTPPDAGAGPDGGAAPDASAPEADAGSVVPEDPIAVLLRSTMTHRYRFSPGATLLDSIGGANATSVGVTFDAGAAVFAGTGAGQYLDLPNDLVQGVTNLSVEAWVVWTVTDPLASTSSWQRIFDFGRNSSTVEGAQGDNGTGLFLSPRSGGTQGKLHLEYSSNGNINIDGPSALPTNVVVQMVAVIDDDADIMSIYQDGALKGALSFDATLSTITYLNNWLGRSQHTGDPPFRGRILDFRTYAAALTAQHVQASLLAGADADW